MINLFPFCKKFDFKAKRNGGGRGNCVLNLITCTPGDLYKMEMHT